MPSDHQTGRRTVSSAICAGFVFLTLIAYGGTEGVGEAVREVKVSGSSHLG